MSFGAIAILYVGIDNRTARSAALLSMMWDTKWVGLFKILMYGPLNRYTLIRFNSFDSENVIMTHNRKYDTEQS